MGKIVIDDQVMDNVEILAKLSLTDEERGQAMEKMQEILDYMEQLNTLDTDNVEPLVNLYDRGNVFRDDVIEDNDIKSEIVAGAPKQKDGQYMVPKTI